MISRWLVFLFIFIVVDVVRAAPSNESTSKTSIPQEKGWLETEASKIDQFQQAISSRVLRMATQIDMFFGNEKLWEEYNRSYLLLDQRWDQGQQDSYHIDVRAHLSLPRTKNRIKLFLISEEHGEEDRLGPENNELLNDNQGTKAGARFRLLGDQFEKLNVNSRLAVKTRGFNFAEYDPYVEVRVRYRYDIADNRLFEAHFMPAYFAKAKQQYIGGFNYDYTINPAWLFRITSNSAFYEHQRYTNWNNGVGVYYSIKDNKVLSSSVAVSSRDEGGAHLTAYATALGYRQNVGWPWLTMSASTAWTFPKEFNFRRQFQFSLFWQIRFGYI